MADEKCSLALVTGAARRLGRAFALNLAQSGYALLLHYHTSEKQVGQTAAELRSVGMPVYQFGADLTIDAEINSLFSFIDTLPYKLKILVNSASVMQKGDARETSMSDWDATFALNLRAPFLLAQKSAERMGSGGIIINISDIGARKNWTNYPAYLISKSGLETLTRVLAKTYAPKIRVNAIAPGLVLPSENIAQDEWTTLVDRLPLKHPVSIDEVIAALEFLLKNESITGQVIVVDGGYSLI